MSGCQQVGMLPLAQGVPLDLCGIGIPVAGFGIWQMLGEMGEGRGAMAVMVGLGVSSLVQPGSPNVLPPPAALLRGAKLF